MKKNPKIKMTLTDHAEWAGMMLTNCNHLWSDVWYNPTDKTANRLCKRCDLIVTHDIKADEFYYHLAGY